MSKDSQDLPLVEALIADQKESEKWSRDLMDKLPIAVVEHAADTSILFCNRQALKWLGLKKDEATGTVASDPRWKFQREDGTAMPVDEFPVVQVLNTLEPLQNYVVGVERPDSHEEAWMLIDAYPQFDEEKALKTVLVTFREITERKKLHHEQERLINILDTIGDPIFVKDNDHRVVLANSAFCDIFAMDIDSVIGKTLVEHVPAKERKHFLAVDRQVLDTGIPNVCEETLTLPGRATLNIVTRKARIVDPSGNNILVGSIHDITERKQAEAAQHESEQRFNDLVNSTDGIVWEADATTFDFVSVSRNTERVLGYRAEEWLESGFWAKHIHPDDRDRAVQYCAACTSSAENHEFEYRFIAAGGRVVWLRDTVTVVTENGQPRWLRGLMIDITAQKTAEIALRESEVKYRTFFEHSADAMLIIRDYEFVDCNSATVNMLKYETKEDLLGTRPSELSPEFQSDGKASYDKSKEMMDIALAQGTHRFEWDHRRQDGEVFPVEVSLTAIPQGGEMLLHTVWLDITERKRTVEALGESTRRYHDLFDQANEGLLIMTTEGQFSEVNRAFAEMHGYSVEELSRKNIRELDVLRDGALEDRGDIIRRIMDGEIVRFEVEHYHKDGHIFPLSVTTNLIELGGQSFFLAFHQDITERKRAEEEKRGLERQIQQAQKLESLGVLAGGIAHDFNNLLAVILGNSELALDGLSPHSAARDNIEEIEKASRRAAELAKQMLAYSGKGKFVIEPIDLGEFIDEMAHLLDVSISKKVVLKYNFADNLPTFDGDATQIRQIIMNLIINASEAIGDRSGVIALSTGAMHCDRAYLEEIEASAVVGLDEPITEKVYVYLEVADTGSGMDAETIDKIFDPFFTTKFTGRGLGMSATQGIIRGHKGVISISSEVGKGTTFKVHFPANELSEDGAALAGGGDAGTATAWQGTGTVLIVDDEETICAVGRQMVERMGFSALTAADGREAVEVFREHSKEIVCVLLDLTMPHMGGEEAFGELRHIQPDVSVILCSGYSMQDARRRFTGQGLAGFLQKPYEMGELRDKLAQLLGP